MVVDLDEAAALVDERVPRWRAAGLVPGRPTWRDAAAPWPQPLLTDRSSVHDPDSLGIVLTGPSDSELQVCLYRGGRADIDFFDLADCGVLPTPDLTSAADFATHLDRWVLRVFGALTTESAPAVAEPGTPTAPSAAPRDRRTERPA